MILDIDMGNTRIKWLLKDRDRVVERGAFAAESMTAFFASLNDSDYEPQRVRVASVRPSLHEVFDRLCLQYWQLQPEYAIVSRQYKRIVNAYQDVSQMGVDRWMGIIAASQLIDSPCLVVSAGSAMTVDLLDNDAGHLGGFIVPGGQLMRQSLYRDTDQVKLAQIDYDIQPALGKNTRQAVSSGIVLMQMGLLQQSLALLVELVDAADVVVIVSGGDGQRLCEILSNGATIPALAGVIYEPDLVFKGLSLAL